MKYEITKINNKNCLVHLFYYVLKQIQCLKLTHTSLSEKTTIGQMINLLENDVNRFEISCCLLSYLWASPLQAIVTTIVLYHYIGPSSLVGIGLMLICVPFQGTKQNKLVVLLFITCNRVILFELARSGEVFSKLRGEMARRTDTRLQFMKELITGIRVIKLYAWEKPFAQMIENFRRWSSLIKHIIHMILIYSICIELK